MTQRRRRERRRGNRNLCGPPRWCTPRSANDAVRGIVFSVFQLVHAQLMKVTLSKKHHRATSQNGNPKMFPHPASTVQLLLFLVGRDCIEHETETVVVNVKVRCGYIV